LRDTDLVVGAVLVPGAKAPSLVAREDLSTMRPGSVIVDVAVDQGGCVETIRPTTHDDPVYEVDGVIHYGVTNMPGAVPRTSTLALTNATLPYALQVACKGWRRACEEDHCFAPGINIVGGRIVHPGVAEAFGMVCESLDGAAPRAVDRIRFKRLPSNPDLALPARASGGAAGYDIRSCEGFRLAPGGVHAARTGLVMELPEGIECQVRPRSGLAARHGITLPNSPGTIDSDYRGELRILMQNLGPDSVEIGRGDRIAQLVFNRCLAPLVEETSALSATGRGDGGFGSTGVK